MLNTFGFMRGSAALSLLILLGMGITPVSAQTLPAVPSDRLGWTQSADASELALLTFAVFVDGTRQPLPSATCVQASASVAECQSPLPAMTPGNHTLELIAIRTEGGLIAESPKSAPLSIRIVVVTAPSDLRIIR